MLSKAKARKSAWLTARRSISAGLDTATSWAGNLSATIAADSPPMKRAIAAALIASTLLAGLSNARATEHGKAAEPAGHGENGGGDVSRTMDAPFLAVPVIRDGQLVNYLFVSIRVQ